MKNKLILAIDTANLFHALDLVAELGRYIAVVKLGLEFFSSCGANGVRRIAKLGIPIFLDLKLYDIPTTVAKTITVLNDLPITMVTVHIAGGRKMLKAAVHSAHKRLRIIGVTVLTSNTVYDAEEVVEMASIAQECQLNGVVASVAEARAIKAFCGKDFIVITPGIRLGQNYHDQKRTATPIQAFNAKADYIVLGRTVTQSSHRLQTIHDILLQLHIARKK